MKRKLPIGIQDFVKIREEAYCYVDKTARIYELLTGSGGVFFLSRPRRLGMSLLCSTLAAIFESRRELFSGFAIDGAMNMLIPFFAAIPYDITLKQEKYYQTVIHLVFRMLGLYCQPEVKIAAGRIDTLVETRNYVYSQWGLIPRPSGLNLTHGILSSAGAYRR